MSSSELSPPGTVANPGNRCLLRKEQYRVVGIVSLGGCLEFYDFAIFVFFADVIGQAFFPVGMPSWLTSAQTWGFFAAGYVFRPLGGVVLAHFGDLFGRKRVFAFSILLMATSTLGIGFLPTYATIGVAAPFLLLFMRVLQGIAIGGEVPGAWTFVAEHVPSKNVGRACGIVCGGLTLGILLASSVATAVTSLLHSDEVHQFGWRLPFLLGGFFGLAGMKLRRMLKETPVFSSLRKRKMLVPELPLRVVLQTGGYGIIRSITVTWVLSIVVVLTLMMPIILRNGYGYRKEEALVAASVSTLFQGLGVVFGGALLDRIGAAKFYLLFTLVLSIGAVSYAKIANSHSLELLALCAIVGLSGGVTAGTPYVMVASFPARIRYTGVSFAYNMSYAFLGGVMPVLINAVSPLGVIAPVLFFVALSISALGMGLVLMFRSSPLVPE
ncbi:MFS transporter [Phyllobacterium sp. SB3]|uniref:MFS transporter n=1 Tax=Phyllobacterium sp. SB3 TaxID=3156073 RepID=UPI0032AED789